MIIQPHFHHGFCWLTTRLIWYLRPSVILQCYRTVITCNYPWIILNIMVWSSALHSWGSAPIDIYWAISIPVVTPLNFLDLHQGERWPTVPSQDDGSHEQLDEKPIDVKGINSNQALKFWISFFFRSKESSHYSREWISKSLTFKRGFRTLEIIII